MATTTMRGQPVHTSGDLVAPGSTLPAYSLVGSDFAAVTAQPGAATVLNVFPSVDTPVCAASVRRFNEEASGLDGVRVVCVSMDLPFALSRFCGAEGIEGVTAASAFRSGFGDDLGLRLVDGPFEGLLARAVIVADAEGTVRHVELVADIGTEPDYDAALAAL